MKTNIKKLMLGLTFLMTGWIAAQAQYKQEVPGDNFSLEGALELFKKSESPEQFERMLNDPESHVNNLDLNADGYIDYIRVVDLFENNVHVFVIQAVISHNEFQDIAVITLEKRANGKAVLQITGDEDIYGVETIIEPTKNVYTYAGQQSSRVVVNVWSWPMVRYVYSPYYNVWVSPWHWNYRPHWWRPWRPVVYYDYYTYWRPYRHHYTVCYSHRIVYGYRFYRPHRSTSIIVYNNHYHHVAKYRSAHIDKSGYYKRNDRSSRTRSTSIRYNPDGRIRTRGDQSTNRDNTRALSDDNRRSNRTQSSYRNTSRSSTSSKVRSNSYTRDNSGSKVGTSSAYRSGTSNRISNQTKGTSDRISRSQSKINSNSSRSSENYSGNSQRSSSAPKVNSSKTGSVRSSTIRSSSGRSSSNSTLNRSSGGTSNRSNIHRSPSKSSNSSGIRHSSSGSSSRSSIQRSGSKTNVKKVSSSSAVNRSSRSSGSQKKSISSSRSASNSRSKSSSSKKRGRN